MRRTIQLITAITALACCFHKNAAAKLALGDAKKHTAFIDSAKRIAYDTTITPFNDKSYILKLHTSEKQSDNSKYNTLLIFERHQYGKVIPIFRDSLYCFNNWPDVKLIDMNNDKVNDVMITYEMSGGNSNMMYHLYVCDARKHKLIRIKYFENIYNPELNKKYNIVESFVLSGTDYYTFHRINSDNKLINLGYSFNVNRKDENSDKMKVKYNHAIKQILKKHGD